MGRDAFSGKLAYIWISLDPMKVGPTLWDIVVETNDLDSSCNIP